VHFTKIRGASPSRAGKARSIGTLQAIARRERVFTEGQSADHFYQVRSGIVRTYTISDDGRRTIDGFHFAGDIFGLELGALHRNSAAGIDDITVVAFRYSDIDSFADADETFAKELRLSLIANLARAQDHILLLARKTAAEKIAGFLVQMAQRAAISKTGNLPLHHADIADYLGLSRETVSRVLSDLSFDGLVEVKGPKIRH
jgi:CRP/FNR family nitrogen fixation transcriptional regulator